MATAARTSSLHGVLLFKAWSLLPPLCALRLPSLELLKLDASTCQHLTKDDESNTWCATCSQNHAAEANRATSVASPGMQASNFPHQRFHRSLTLWNCGASVRLSLLRLHPATPESNDRSPSGASPKHITSQHDHTRTSAKMLKNRSKPAMPAPELARPLKNSHPPKIRRVRRRRGEDAGLGRSMAHSARTMSSTDDARLGRRCDDRSKFECGEKGCYGVWAAKDSQGWGALSQKLKPKKNIQAKCYCKNFGEPNETTATKQKLTSPRKKKP